MMRRIDELSVPPQIGRMYLVPTVYGRWFGSARHWPVIGPKHHDTQCLRFEPHHYHLDVRFLGRKPEGVSWRFVFSAPLITSDRINPDGLPAPEWRARKCQRLINPALDEINNLTTRAGNWKCHFDQWAGKQARHDGRGWVCPHRNVSLADQAVDGDGVITCPLHLLRIDARTGRVLPPLPAGTAVPA